MSKKSAAQNNKETATKKVVGRPFQKGQSGNPGGRPAIPEEFKELAKTKSLEALKKLIKIYEDEKTPVAECIRAIALLLSYGVGKPVETVNLAPADDDIGEIQITIKRQATEG